MLIFNASKEKILAIMGFLSIVIMIFLYISNGIIYLSDRYVTRIKIENTDEAFREFLKSYGLTALPEECVTETIKIPKIFDDAFKDYERIQNEMGLSLNEFKGKKVTRYTYRIENTYDLRTLYANILYYKGYVVAVDVNCPDLETGFVKSFLDI